MSKVVCKECDGTGTIEKDGKLYNCECFFVQQAATSMPKEIRRATILSGHVSLKVIQAVNESVFIKGTYDDIKSVIKAVMLKYPNKWIKMITDADIRNVYVGGMSKASHAEDYSGEIYNNIQELMGPPDLMIVRLNVISNKNKAAPGALEEAISHRINNDKPIWLISTNESQFSQSSYAYSLRVEEIIESGCSKVTIPQISTKSQSVLSNPIEPEYLGKNNVQSTTFNKSEKPKPRIKSSDDIDGVDPVLAGFGSGVSKKKKFSGDH